MSSIAVGPAVLGIGIFAFTTIRCWLRMGKKLEAPILEKEAEEAVVADGDAKPEAATVPENEDANLDPVPAAVGDVEAANEHVSTENGSKVESSKANGEKNGVSAAAENGGELKRKSLGEEGSDVVEVIAEKKAKLGEEAVTGEAEVEVENGVPAN